MSLSLSVNATYDGVVLFPWSLFRIYTRSFYQTPTHEYVVPRSIPIAFFDVLEVMSQLMMILVMITNLNTFFDLEPSGRFE